MDWPLEQRLRKFSTPKRAAHPGIVVIERLSNRASMGPGVDLSDEDHVIEGITLTEERVALIAGRRQNYSALKVIPAIGDSMEPTLRDGDFVLVDTSKRSIDVDGIFALRTPERLFIKRVSQVGDNDYEVTSDNPAVPKWKSLAKRRNVEIVGRVVWAWNGRKL